MTPQFYVYVMARPNGKPFYVGKGSFKTKKPRLYDHEREARRGHRCHKCNVIRKIWKQGGTVQCYIVFTSESEQEAYNHERVLIEMYGLETLANQTVGGLGGMKGVIYPEEQRAAIKVRAQALAQDPEWRRKVSEATKAAWKAKPGVRQRLTEMTRQRYTDPEYRQKHAEAVRRVTNTEKHRQKLREAQLRRYEDPEERRNQVERMKATRTPEALQKKSQKTTEQWQDPVMREKRIEGQRRAFEKEETRQAVSAGLRRRYESTEEREKTSAANRRRYEDPREREKTAEANVRHWGYSYTLYAPDGTTYTTNNLQRFCLDRGLNPSHMRQVITGKLKAHKGWTGTRTKQPPQSPQL